MSGRWFTPAKNKRHNVKFIQARTRNRFCGRIKLLLQMYEKTEDPQQPGAFEMAEVSTKRKAVKAVEELPDEATLDDAIEKLIFLRKIERGLRQRESGEGIPQEEVEKRFGVSWQK